MAHMIDMSNDRANMAYKGEVPWHGLGQALTAGASLEQWAQEAGMAWEARLASVAYRPIIGDADPKSADPRNFAAKVDNEHRVLYRSDTGAALGIVSPDYRIVQPSKGEHSVIGFFRDLTEKHGFELETAGCLRGGRIAWAMAKAGSSFGIGKGDEQKPYLMLSTSFDGSRATEARFCAVRVVCNNTINIAWKENGEVVKVRHSSSFDADRVKVKLEVGEAWVSYCEKARILATAPADPDRTLDVLMAAYFGRSVEDMQKSDEDKARGKRIIERLTPILAGAPGQNTEAASGSLWGVLNAVTYDVDHTFPTRGANGFENRFVSAQFGVGAAIKARALRSALAMAA